jgi:nucleotide-binding universal stress UspA family protein
MKMSVNQLNCPSCGRTKEPAAMYRHLLIATDGSELAQMAVVEGLALAKELKATVTAVTVTEPIMSMYAGEGAIAFPVEEFETAVRTSAEEILAGVDTVSKQRGVQCKTVHVKDQYPAEGIVETAQAMKCDLIVMASHGRRGLAKLFLGSQATRVLGLSPIPVLICK